MSKHIISESQLRQIVEESVRTYLMENGMDEAGNPLDFVRSVGAGLRNAFGGDVDRVKGTAQGAWDNVKQAGQNAWDGVKQAGQAVADKATGAYNQAADAVKQRKDAFVQNYQANQKANAAEDAAKSGAKQAEKAIATLRKLQQNGVISNNGKGAEALNQLERSIILKSRGAKGLATKARNKVK